MSQHDRLSLQSAFAQRREWQDKYRLLMALGADLPTTPTAAFPPQSKLVGCESEAWLWPSGEQHLHCAIASPSRIVRGLLRVLCVPVELATPDSVLAFDFEQYLADLGLAAHLSASRGNGLRLAVQQLRDWAEARA